MKIRALALDTGGTVLDWHGRIHRALREAGQGQGLVADWHAVTNDYRRRAMQAIVGQQRADFNMDDVHARVLPSTLESFGLQALGREAQETVVAAWRELDAWPDVRPGMELLRQRWPVVSFTMLPTALVVEVSRRNGMVWDAVISCEMTGMYKPNPQAYLTTARWLQLAPSEILMVACHNFDLDAARGVGYRCAFVRRPNEWGPAGPPDPHPNPANDFIAADFMDLARQLDAVSSDGSRQGRGP